MIAFTKETIIILIIEQLFVETISIAKQHAQQKN